MNSNAKNNNTNSRAKIAPQIIPGIRLPSRIEIFFLNKIQNIKTGIVAISDLNPT